VYINNFRGGVRHPEKESTLFCQSTRYCTTIKKDVTEFIPVGNESPANVSVVAVTLNYLLVGGRRRLGGAGINTRLNIGK